MSVGLDFLNLSTANLSLKIKNRGRGVGNLTPICMQIWGVESSYKYLNMVLILIFISILGFIFVNNKFRKGHLKRKERLDYWEMKLRLFDGKKKKPLFKIPQGIVAHEEERQ